MTATRRLAAILAADVAGYSRLMGADEEGTLDRLKAHRRKLTDPKIKEHHGRIVKTTGDGALVEFPSVVDAVRCAVEVQRAMVERNAEIPEDRRIAFRIGINLGDVIIDGNDIYGDGVNIAARLEALAEPGGICISRVVRDQIRDKLPYAFEDLGEQSVKNIARPLRVYAMSANAAASIPLNASPAQPARACRPVGPQRAAIVAALVAVISIASAIWWTWPQRSRPTVAVPTASLQGPPALTSVPAPRLSFVVLPFENLSRDPDQEYFADGITDDLTTDLSRISGSFVIARNTAFTYKGKAVDAKQIGRELGVHYAIEGSVRRAGNQVQVNVQLIDGETGAHVWADRFEADRTNLTEAQSEITGRLARSLNLELVEVVGRRIERDKTANPDARDLIMRGWALYYRTFSIANREESERLFERALEIDPQSVDARVGIATVLVSNMVDGWSSSTQQDGVRTENLLREVLERDANVPMAHFALGLLRRTQVRLPESGNEFETAIAQDRNFARAIFQLGLTLFFLGQPQAAIPHIEKAIRLNPHDSNLTAPYWGLGACHLLMGEADQAIGLLQKARAANPRFWWPHIWLAGALGLRGDLDEAQLELGEALRLKPNLGSLAAWRADRPWEATPQLAALAEKTL